MKTIILDQPENLELIDSEFPAEVKNGEAIVRVERVGICGTDLHAFSGNQNFFSYPRILGHELAVTVEAIGDSTSVIGVGDVCCVIPYLFCGTCIACRHGKTNCCVNMQVLGVHVDGGMREQFRLPADKLLKADGIAVEHLALVEMLSIGAHAVQRALLEVGDVALVIGAGPIGLATASFARLAGARVLVMDVNEQRLQFCQNTLGFEDTIHAKKNSLGQIKDSLGGDLPRFVFDATGNSGSMHAAFDYVAHGGSLVYVGHIKGDISFSDPHFHSHEMTLLASRNATQIDFEWVIDCLRNDLIDLNLWITHTATPEEMVTDFSKWIDPATGVIKAMLTFG